MIILAVSPTKRSQFKRERDKEREKEQARKNESPNSYIVMFIHHLPYLRRK